MTKRVLRSPSDYPSTSDTPFMPKPAAAEGAVVYLILYRKDFYSSPKIECVTMDLERAEDLAYDLARRKFRYSGRRLPEYSYFDQAIRIESYPLS